MEIKDEKYYAMADCVNVLTWVSQRAKILGDMAEDRKFDPWFIEKVRKIQAGAEKALADSRLQ